PVLFHWYGACDPSRLQAWLEERQITPPPDLLTLWLELGGGDIFESEDFLVPFDGPDYALAFDDVNKSQPALGLPESLFLFHSGLCLSAFRMRDPQYVTVDPRTYAVVGEFASLDEWYRSTLRTEYAGRYGLAPEQPRMGRRTTA